MCKTPKAPPVTQPGAPIEAPKPMALPDSGRGSSVSQLRVGSKSNLKLREAVGPAPTSLTIPKGP